MIVFPIILLLVLIAFIVFAIFFELAGRRNIKIRRGKPIRIVKGGWCFRIPFLEKIVYPAWISKYERRSFTVREIEKERCHGLITAKIVADVSVSFTLPEGNEDLFWVAKTIPLEQEKCKEFLEEPVLDAIRDVGKNKTWLEWIENRRDIEEKAAEKLLNDRKSPFRKAKIFRISVNLENITVKRSL